MPTVPTLIIKVSFFFPSSPSHRLGKYFNLGGTTQEMGPTEGNSEAQEPPRKNVLLKTRKNVATTKWASGRLLIEKEC